MNISAAYLLGLLRKVFPVSGNKVILLSPYKIKFCIADTRDTMQSMIYYFNRYEPRITKLITDNLSEGDSFFDIGASTGYFSLIAAGKVGPCGKIHAFEPLGQNYKIFEINRALNNFDNITINNMVVSDMVGDVTFYPPGNPDERGTGSIFDGDREKAFSAPSVTLEYYIKSNDIKRVDLIKIDTEGSELKIINGLKPAIAGIGYPKIICEVNEAWLRLAGSRPEDLTDTLKGLGYRIYTIGKGRLFNIFAVR